MSWPVPLGPQGFIPEPEDAYVEWDEAEPDPNADSALLEHRYQRTELVVQGSSWSLADWSREDRARRAAAGAFDAGGRIEIIAPQWEPDVRECPTPVRKLQARVASAGFDVHIGCSIAYVTPTLFAAAKEGEHDKGDLRFEDHDDTWWGVQARLLGPERRVIAAFWATWRLKEQAGAKPSTTFQGAVTRDVVLGLMPARRASDFDEWLTVFAPQIAQPSPRGRTRGSD